MPPQGSPVPGLERVTEHQTGPTQGPVIPAPGGPHPQHLGRWRAEMGLAGRHTTAPGEARPRWEGIGDGSPRERAPSRAHRESRMTVS